MRYICLMILCLYSLLNHGQEKKIGDVIVNPDGSQGVVFWLNPDGTGGWMVAMKDLPKAAIWGEKTVNIPDLPDMATLGGDVFSAVLQDTAGYENTKKIRKVQIVGSNYIAQLVDFKNGWYLPALGQLRRLFAAISVVNPVLQANGGEKLRDKGQGDFINYTYFSSTEGNDTTVWCCLNTNGMVGTIVKNTQLYSRAVRSFSYTKVQYDPNLSYEWNGGKTTPAITDPPQHSKEYEVTVTSSLGCKNKAAKQVFVAASGDTTIMASICRGETYRKHGFDVSAAGSYSNVLRGDNGCDLTVNLILTVNEPQRTEFIETICEGEIYTRHNFTAWETGSYTQTWASRAGCDSIVTLKLTVNPIKRTFINDAICRGETYTNHGFQVTKAGSYERTLQSTSGCDSVVTLILAVNPVYKDTIHASIKSGESYNANGFHESVAGVYPHIGMTVAGCDSIVTLVLEVEPASIDTVRAAICRGNVYHANGFNESQAGTYTRTYQNDAGQDCLMRLILTVNPVYNQLLQASICRGEVYTDNGFNETVAGKYVQNLTGVNGCDSIVTLLLTVNPVYDTTIIASICEGEEYNANGFRESVSGIYPRVLQSRKGCDSIVTLDLRVNPTYTFESVVNICEGGSYDFFGTLLTDAGVYHKAYKTIAGCDSIYRLTLHVCQPADTLIRATICRGDRYRDNGFDVTDAGEYVLHLKTQMQCDSTVTLHLEIEEPFEGGIVVNLNDCEAHSYLFDVEPADRLPAGTPWMWDLGDGSTAVGHPVEHSYSASGIYQVNLRVGQVCEKVIEYTLNVPEYPKNVEIYSDRKEIDSKNPQVHLWTDRLPNVLYNWDMDDGTLLAGYEVRHVYDLRNEYYNVTLTVINTDSCSVKQQYRIRVFTDIIPPNTFSPNEDGVNDIFMPGLRIRIVNRNGLEIFSGDNGWDGTYKGEQALEDTYFYEIYFLSAQGEEVKKGYITVVR